MELFEEPKVQSSQVTCLGKTFKNEDERREHFTALLREKLKDPEFRKIDGFPLGEEEDILALSDPPYYTACPNPWLNEFVLEWKSKKNKEFIVSDYHRDPFNADITEGKNHPIYTAHSYHTKVPHRAIMRYILHYTLPGDIVFDGFCGSGMTGVAAQMCGDKDEVSALGYKVLDDGTILREEISPNNEKVLIPFSKLGSRNAILNDLSPSASFISYNYNRPVNIFQFKKQTEAILMDLGKENKWMYETLGSDGRKGIINYTVWSDTFICPICTREVVFWEVAVNKKNGKVLDDFPCPHCGSYLSKEPANPKNEEKKPSNKRRPISSKLERSFVNIYDSSLGRSIKQIKQVPVIIKYTIDRKKLSKTPDSFDIEKLQKIDEKEIDSWYPSNRMMVGKESRRNDPVGITHVHHFFTKRNLLSLSSFYNRCNRDLKLIFHSVVVTLCSKLVRYNNGKRGNGPLSGTLYISSLNAEAEISKVSLGKIKDFSRAFILKQPNVISCQDFGHLSVQSNSMDYLFLDPPFGSNLDYSELNYLWESWLKVWTNNTTEAIESKTQGKGLIEYRQLMTNCFKEAFRVLKPGRWMTVEFSNTKATVWNSIRKSIEDAGFIISNVSVLDKKQKSYKAVTTTTAVKQDLVISAYKPNGGFIERFENETQTEEGVWDFIRSHLKYLPITKGHSGVLLTIPERDPRILYDQLISYYFLKGHDVPISSQAFQMGLTQWFSERDGMIFLSEQVLEYDKKKIIYGGNIQTSIFVSDESSAIQWLRDRLRTRPQIKSDIYSDFMPLMSHLKSNEKELINLDLLLDQNFIKYDGNGPVPEQIHSYLSSNWKEFRNLSKDDEVLMRKAIDRWYLPDPNKQSDLEKIRDKSLLKEFEIYCQSNKKLKVFRLEVIRTGFKKAWQEKDYNKIIKVAKLIPNEVLESDPKLLMWYDHSQTRLGGE